MKMKTHVSSIIQQAVVKGIQLKEYKKDDVRKYVKEKTEKLMAHINKREAEAKEYNRKRVGKLIKANQGMSRTINKLNARS